VISDQIHAIWARELKLTDFSEGDDFFELGGHSLIMARIQTAIQQEFGAEIPMDELMRHSTVQQISVYLEKAAAVTH